MRARTTLVIVVSTLALIVAACGSDNNDSDNAAGTDRQTIEIEMRDIAFAPDSISVPAGEEVRLVFHNTGKVDHDAFIGDDMAQADHDKEMKEDSGGMHHGDDDVDAITVESGKTGTLTHTFKAGDELLIGCHQPGHYAAGMKLTVDVN